MTDRRQSVGSFLIVAVPVVVETAGRWVELAVSLLGVAVGVAVFRRWPVPVLSLAVVGALVPALVLAPTAANPPRVWPFVACAVFGYLVGRRVASPRPVLATLGAVLLAGLPVSVVADAGTRGGFGVVFGLYDWFLLVLVLLLVVVLPWLAGRYLRLRAELRVAAVDRAAAGERTRIAREMHDSLGHEWGLIALRAGGVRGVAAARRAYAGAGGGDPGRRRRGHRAAARDHRVARRTGGHRPPRAGRRATAAGQVVELGAVPAGLPLPVARAVHRVVREGLTNAAKHAPGGPVTVHVESTR